MWSAWLCINISSLPFCSQNLSSRIFTVVRSNFSMNCTRTIMVVDCTCLLWSIWLHLVPRGVGIILLFLVQFQKQLYPPEIYTLLCPRWYWHYVPWRKYNIPLIARNAQHEDVRYCYVSIQVYMRRRRVTDSKRRRETKAIHHKKSNLGNET